MVKQISMGFTPPYKIAFGEVYRPVDRCPYPPTGECLHEPEIPGSWHCENTACWEFGKYCLEFYALNPPPADKINLPENYLTDCHKYAQRREAGLEPPPNLTA